MELRNIPVLVLVNVWDRFGILITRATTGSTVAGAKPGPLHPLGSEPFGAKTPIFPTQFPQSERWSRGTPQFSGRLCLHGFPPTALFNVGILLRQIYVPISKF
jgi:hypothetical protein